MSNYNRITLKERVRIEVGIYMTNEVRWIETVQGIFGMMSMVLLILINFIGWTLYYMGHQYGWLIIISQFAVVPFFVIHTINGIMNFAVKK